jgi:hypothetical protein
MHPALAKVRLVSTTINHLGLARVAMRLLRKFRYRFIYPQWGRMMFKTNPAPYLPELSTGNFPALLSSPAQKDSLVREAEELRHQTFTFLNLPPKTFATSIDWRFAPNQDPLWQYCLHYGEWALTLAQAFLLNGDAVYRQSLINLLTDWVGHNPPGSTPGWEPYPLARRLVTWSKVAVSLKSDESWQSFWQSTLAPCLHTQTRMLAGNLETDLANNHLIADYRALAWMGLLFPDWPGAATWRQSGLAGLWGEMERQVMADGVHDERSLSYHAIVLQDLVETWDLCRGTGVTVPGNLEQRFSRMTQFLDDMQAPDGSYPMVNDTVPGYPDDISTVVAYAQARLNYWTPVPAGGENGGVSSDGFLQAKPDGCVAEKSCRRVSAYPEAGYAIIKSEGGEYLCFDAGAMGPEHLPGHGHADALSFVLYCNHRPLVVDPGVYSYHDKSWRDYFRSTRAHNTVCIDDQDQCVFWGAFRVAYPPKVRLLGWSDNHVEGEHQGYCRLNDPVVHRRLITRRGKGHWELLDRFEGRGVHEFTLSLQLASEARVEQHGVCDATVHWPELTLRISVPSPSPEMHAAVEPGWVSPGWNLKTPAPRYVLQWKAKVPCVNRLTLKREE